jgi:DNA modification methylase
LRRFAACPSVPEVPYITKNYLDDALEAAGFEVRCQIIWAKNTFAWGFGRYKFQHEPIFYCHVAGQKDPWYGDKSQSTLWEQKKPAANRVHPTAKPVELIDRALINSSKSGGLVVDLFGGSGSTLLACERRGRRARLMEIDPRYADCIVGAGRNMQATRPYWTATDARSRRWPRSEWEPRRELHLADGRSRI